MDIVEEVKKLGFPLGEYIVVGSGVLQAHGIREAKDIDIVATDYLCDQLKAAGWDEKPGKESGRALIKGNIEVMSDCKTGSYRPNTEDLIDAAEIIRGVPFMSLIELKKFKQALGREKDARDIELIDLYLEKK